ncbi:hypothetical protein GQ55_2G380100 [Panicum hallii var. hallii]|uniref:Uncharacterized protein n=1 Tax=Panicum hallii var. hallii TaxID=1504633 RepID=A0A2T7EWR0_9POAL|nr:hypothetical protein GQ55_2G380100 [Panicum hallii var. hallii]
MEDFYVTIPNGLVVLAGGVAGYLKRGSAASLAAGVGFGAALLLAGALSAWAFAHGGGGAGAVFGTVLQIVCAVVLTVVMGVRYVKTRKIMPAGIIAAIRYTGVECRRRVAVEELRPGGSCDVHAWIEGASGDRRWVSWFAPQNQGS